MSEKPLTLKQRRFVRAYLETGNATEAARRAGYQGADDTLAKIGSQNLGKPLIASAIDSADRDEEHGAIATRNEIRERLTRIGFGIEQAAFITEFGTVVMVPPELAQQLKALEMLARSKGMFIDRQKIDASVRLFVVPESDDEAAARLAALGKRA